MSVAFRREGDEEHLEPKFEIPIPPGPNRVTARGLALIRARLADVERAMAAHGSTGADHAPGSADAAALTALQRDLRYWQTRAITAEEMPPPAGDVVAFGTTVDIRLDGKPRSLSLVGDDEADPAAGLIAFSAPLARALAGGEPGDILPFGGREEAIEILAVAPYAGAAGA